MLPLLAILVLALLVTVWILWFRCKDGRALRIGEDEERHVPRRYPARKRD